MSPLWTARSAALEALAGEMSEEGGLLNEVFERLDEAIGFLERIDTEYARVTAITLVKARNLGLGCYSLCLDGLAQEGGALFRPLVEALELLIYFRLDPARVREASDNTLPPAGKRAKLIASHFQSLRDHLSQNASHLGWSYDSMGHLIDFRKLALRIEQRFSVPVLRRNLQFLFAVLAWIAIEAVNTVGKAGELHQHDLGERVEDLKKRGLAAFERLIGPSQ